MWRSWAFFFFLGTSSTLTQESEGAGERVVVKKKTHQEDGMWRSWAFFFFWGALTPLIRTGSGSLAHRLTGSPAHRLKTSCSQTKPGICIWKGYGVLLPKCGLWGRALDCYFQRVFFLEGPFFDLPNGLSKRKTFCM